MADTSQPASQPGGSTDEIAEPGKGCMLLEFTKNDDGTSGPIRVHDLDTQEVTPYDSLQHFFEARHLSMDEIDVSPISDEDHRKFIPWVYPVKQFVKRTSEGREWQLVTETRDDDRDEDARSGFYPTVHALIGASVRAGRLNYELLELDENMSKEDRDLWSDQYAEAKIQAMNAAWAAPATVASPTIPLDSPEMPEMDHKKAYYAYLDEAVTDAETHGPVTELTELTAIYSPTRYDAGADNMKNRMFATRPRLASQFVDTDEHSAFGDETCYPVFERHGKPDASYRDLENTSGLSMTVRFNEIDIDPGVLVSLDVRTKESYEKNKADAILYTAIFEFKFNGGVNIDPKTMHIETRREGKHYVIDWHFTSRLGAMYAGQVARLLQDKPSFSIDDQRLVDRLMSYTSPGEGGAAHNIHIRSYTREPKLSDQKLDAEGKLLPFEMESQIAELLRHLPGSPVASYVPMSFNKQPYSAFHSLADGKLQIKANKMIAPATARQFDPPNPQAPMAASNMFASTTAAAVKMNVGTHTSFMEEKKKLQLLTKVRHKVRLYPQGSIVIAALEFKPHEILNMDTQVKTRIPKGSIVSLSYQGRSGHEQKMKGIVVNLPDKFHVPYADLTLLLVDRAADSFGMTDDDGTPHSQLSRLKDYSTMTTAEKKLFLRKGYMCDVTISPNKSVYEIQMDTIDKLVHSDQGQQWHDMLLNQ